MITKVVQICLLMCGVVNCSVDFFREFLEPDIFSAHGLHPSATTLSEINTVVNEIDDMIEASIYFCGPLSDLKRKMAEVSQLSIPVGSDHSQVVYLKKSKQRACFVSHLSNKIMIAQKKEVGSLWTMEHFPDVLKVHSSVLQYLSFTTRKSSPLNDSEFISKHRRKRSKTDDLRNKATMTLEEEINLAGNALRIHQCICVRCTADLFLFIFLIILWPLADIYYCLQSLI